MNLYIRESRGIIEDLLLDLHGYWIRVFIANIIMAGSVKEIDHFMGAFRSESMCVNLGSCTSIQVNHFNVEIDGLQQDTVE